MSFRDKVRDAHQGVVLYEVIPPPEGTLDSAVQSSVESLQDLCARVAIDAINIPEVRSESRPGVRGAPLISKIEPRQYGRLIQKTFGARLETIVNRGTVYAPFGEQQEWLRATWQEFGIRNLVLVGGESSRRRYSGPSVTEAAELITRYLNSGCVQGLNGQAPATAPATDYFCGGITIPSRRKPDPHWDEPGRLINKSQHGLEFFTSQVLYEAESTKRLLHDYVFLCRRQGESPRRIFLSFAPVSSEKDLQFLKWLGVDVPSEIERYILDGWIGVAWRSIKVACQVLFEILNFAEAERLSVPLGLNVEHVMRHNFEVSREMTAELSQIYSDYVVRRRLEVPA